MINVGTVGRRAVAVIRRAGEVAKAVAAAAGALTTALAPVVADDMIGLDEVGTVTAALAAAVGTVYAVWRVPNRGRGE